MSWFRFAEGKVSPTDEPEWAKVADGGGPVPWNEIVLRKYARMSDHGDPDSVTGFSVYRQWDGPSWCFEFTDGFSCYSVLVEGFPDYLDFLLKLAPLAPMDDACRESMVRDDQERKTHRATRGAS